MDIVAIVGMVLGAWYFAWLTCDEPGRAFYPTMAFWCLAAAAALAHAMPASENVVVQGVVLAIWVAGLLGAAIAALHPAGSKASVAQVAGFVMTMAAWHLVTGGPGVGGALTGIMVWCGIGIAVYEWRHRQDNSTEAR